MSSTSRAAPARSPSAPATSLTMGRRSKTRTARGTPILRPLPQRFSKRLARRNRLMASAGASVFQGWDNFYFMVGSAAAGLIGLLFVVVTLTAGFDRDQAQRGQALYMNPTM